MSDQLKVELETFRKLLPQLAAEQGKHALISGEALVGVYESYADALKIGYEKFGVKPFLVKRISADEQVAYFTRDLNPACRA